ncbi:MAG: hypothetical protein EXX96DRAFT_539959 [Benjaminiella poitrasii]|nr:MAG: hypothetical protein EXX96DRAFT_539959 [Benjaminiella poitrasii]
MFIEGGNFIMHLGTTSFLTYGSPAITRSDRVKPPGWGGKTYQLKLAFHHPYLIFRYPQQGVDYNFFLLIDNSNWTLYITRKLIHLVYERCIDVLLSPIMDIDIKNPELKRWHNDT